MLHVCVHIGTCAPNQYLFVHLYILSAYLFLYLPMYLSSYVEGNAGVAAKAFHVYTSHMYGINILVTYFVLKYIQNDQVC